MTHPNRKLYTHVFLSSIHLLHPSLMLFYPFRHFSEENARAMDMSWYKRAVDQHSVEQDSFVYSVPFGSGYNGKSNGTLVTASHSIFVEHRGHKAPAAVVGLQFQHESLAKHFINITSAVRKMKIHKISVSNPYLSVYGNDGVQANLCFG